MVSKVFVSRKFREFLSHFDTMINVPLLIYVLSVCVEKFSLEKVS